MAAAAHRQTAVVEEQPATLRTHPGRRLTSRIGTRALAELRHDRLTLAAAAVLAVLLLLAAAADVLADYWFHAGFSRQDLANGYQRPTLTTPALWLGSDDLGRSEVVRLLYGARVSLAVGLGGATINLTVGLALGMIAGYVQGWFDDLLQFVVGTLSSVPAIPLLLIISVVFEPGPLTLVIVLGALLWPSASLVVRAQTMAVRQREFIAAARTAGASNARIIVRHILPNVLPLVLVLTAIDIGSLILIESALSFLGLGISPPTPSWGNMLTRASQDLARGPWLVYGPGAAIFVTVLCLYLVSDGVRDALDPHLQARRGNAG